MSRLARLRPDLISTRGLKGRTRPFVDRMREDAGTKGRKKCTQKRKLEGKVEEARMPEKRRR